jgi:hypothetical protein
MMKLNEQISSMKKLMGLNESVCRNIALTQEIIDYINRFDTSEQLLRLGGIPIDMLERCAYGFSDEDIKTLMPNELHIKWKDDLENVKYEIQHSKLTPKAWAQKVNLTEPIDVSYEKNKFFIEDGHHRYYAAKILGKPLNIDLSIEMNPIIKLAPELGYDEFHRCVFNQVKGEKALNEEESADNELPQAKKSG